MQTADGAGAAKNDSKEDLMSEEVVVVSAADRAEASSSCARINVPLNLGNWKGLDPQIVEGLLWFHQHLLDRGLAWREAAEAIGFDNSNVFKILKGTYEGSWKNVLKAVLSYKRLAEQRGEIQRAEFSSNSISRLIWGGLDYALANNSITLIVGESRMGKTVCAKAWRDEHNHGRSVYVCVQPYGGIKSLLRGIAEKIGVRRTLSIPDMVDSVYRGFNRNRILILDEAQRLLPGDRRSNPIQVEVVRDIHDQTGAAVALLATQRFEDDLKRSSYQFEQILGRIGMPIRLSKKIRNADILPIVAQYIPRPSAATMETAGKIANSPGRLGILVESLKIAVRLAKREQATPAEAHFLKALAIRRQMMGGEE
jgi:DNA transposition AAA+ family ATPase